MFDHLSRITIDTGQLPFSTVSLLEQGSDK